MREQGTSPSTNEVSTDSLPPQISAGVVPPSAQQEAVPSLHTEALPADKGTFRKALDGGIDLITLPGRKSLQLLLSTLDKMAVSQEIKPGFFRRTAGAVVSFLPVIGKWKMIADTRAFYLHAHDKNDEALMKEARVRAIDLLAELGFDLATLGRGGIARSLITARRLDRAVKLPVVRKTPLINKLPTIDPIRLIANVIESVNGSADVVDVLFGTKSSDLDRDTVFG